MYLVESGSVMFAPIAVARLGVIVDTPAAVHWMCPHTDGVSPHTPEVDGVSLMAAATVLSSRE